MIGTTDAPVTAGVMPTTTRIPKTRSQSIARCRPRARGGSGAHPAVGGDPARPTGHGQDRRKHGERRRRARLGESSAVSGVRAGGGHLNERGVDVSRISLQWSATRRRPGHHPNVPVAGSPEFGRALRPVSGRPPGAPPGSSRPASRALDQRPSVTGSGAATAAQARTWARLTFRVCVRGKSRSGQRRQPAIRWFGPSGSAARRSPAPPGRSQVAGRAPRTSPGGPGPSSSRRFDP
jgi:hypothetical protein